MNTVYVDTKSGLDVNPGTFHEPFKTIAKAVIFNVLRSAGLSWHSTFFLLYKKDVSKALKESIQKGEVDVNGFRQRIWMAVGFVPNEGEQLSGRWLFGNSVVDKDANMQLGLFTNVAPGETITEATLTEPTGTGYARITLIDATWIETGSTYTYPAQVFTGGAGGWTGAIQGYFITTLSAGGTQRIAGIEVDANGPYTIAANDTYTINLSNTTA